MDKRKQENTYKTRGMLMPLLKYRWILRFPNESKENGDMLTCNAVKMTIDYTTRELHVTIRQDLYSMTLHTIFSRMMKNITNPKGDLIAPLGSSQTILLEYLDGSNDKATATLELECAPQSHTFILDYTDGENVAEHELVFSIKNVKEYENIEITEETKNEKVG